MLLPIQNTLHPGPDKPFDHQQDKDEHRDRRAQGKLQESHCEREEKENLDIKHQEDDGVEVVLRFELDGRLPFGLQTAFVNGILLIARFGGGEDASPKPRDGKRNQRKEQRYDEKNRQK